MSAPVGAGDSGSSQEPGAEPGRAYVRTYAYFGTDVPVTISISYAPLSVLLVSVCMPPDTTP